MTASDQPAPEGWSFIFTSAPIENEWLTLEVTPPGAPQELFCLSREAGMDQLKIEFFGPMPEMSLDEFERGLDHARAIYSTGWRDQVDR